MKKLSLWLAAGVLVGAAGVGASVRSAEPSNQTGAFETPVAGMAKADAETGDPETGDSSEDTREWIEVTLETPGSLGVEVLYIVDKLADVKHIRVKGEMNADDLTTIQNMSMVKSIDLSGATGITALPSEYMQNRGLTEFLLPPTLKTIGDKAFYRALSLTHITIPASVRYIGSSAFRECSGLEAIAFEEGCQLTTIGSYAFYEDKALKAISIPDGVKTIEEHTFYYCTSLTDVKFPSGLETIGSYAFCRAALTTADFPESLRVIGNCAFQTSSLVSVAFHDNVNSLGGSCFGNCVDLAEVTLPARYHGYGNSQFSDCPNLKRINCPCVIPPSVTDGIKFNSGSEVYVPDAAVVNYKLDSYWKNYTIHGGFNHDFYEINGTLLLTNDRRIEGTPDLTLLSDAKVTVGGNAPMTAGLFEVNAEMSNYYSTDRYTFGQLINNSPNMSANAVRTNINMYDGNWYFLTMPYDVNRSEITFGAGEGAVRYYDGSVRAANGTGNSWKDVPADGVLQAGRGYIFQTNKQIAMTLPAAQEGIAGYFNPNARVTELEANVSETAANSGWNLVGNPYPSFYDMHYAMLTAPILRWDYSQRKYAAYSLIDDAVVLFPYEAFFIQAADELQSIEFGTKGRQFDRYINRPAQERPEAVSGSRLLFNLKVTGATGSDNTRVVLNPDAADGYEISRDAAKFMNGDETCPMLYTIDDEGNRLAINERPEGNGHVALGVRLPEAGRFEISAGRVDGVVELTDNLTGETRSLAAGGSLAFETETAGMFDDRFTLRLASVGTGICPVGVESLTAEVRVVDGGIEIAGAEGLGVTVAALDGRLMLDGECVADSMRIALPAGVYVVRAGAKTAKCIVK